MQLRNEQVDKVIILEEGTKELLVNKIMQLGNVYTIVDIQYMPISLSAYFTKYSALILLKNITKRK